MSVRRQCLTNLPFLPRRLCRIWRKDVPPRNLGASLASSVGLIAISCVSTADTLPGHRIHCTAPRIRIYSSSRADWKNNLGSPADGKNTVASYSILGVQKPLMSSSSSSDIYATGYDANRANRMLCILSYSTNPSRHSKFLGWEH